MDSLDFIKNSKCCCCDGSMKNDQFINAVTTNYQSEWKHPSHGNVLIPDWPNQATAYVCDSCIDKKMPNPIKYVVEHQDGVVIRHEVEKLKKVQWKVLLWYTGSPSAGHPHSFCSICHEHQANEDEPVHRVFQTSPQHETIEMTLCKSCFPRTLNDENFSDWVGVVVPMEELETFFAEKERNIEEAFYNGRLVKKQIL